MKGLTLAIISMAFLSLYAIFAKVLLESVSPLLILMVVQALAGTILLGVLNVFRKLVELRVRRRELAIIFVISLISSVTAPLLLLGGLSMTSVADTVLISRVEAIAMSIFAVAFLGERMTRHQVAGTAVMFAGVAFLATNGLQQLSDPNAGDILVLLSAVCYAAGNTFFKRFLGHLRPEVIVTMRNISGALMLLTISAALVSPTDLFAVTGPLSWEFAAALLGLVVLVTITGQYLWYKALELTTATRVSLSILLSPLLGVFYAVTLLGETITATQAVGGVLIMLGLATMELHLRQVKGPLMRKFHLGLRHMHSA